MEDKKLAVLRGSELATIVAAIAPYTAVLLGAMDSLGEKAANRLTIAVIISAVSFVLWVMMRHLRFKEEEQGWKERITAAEGATTDAEKELESVRSDKLRALQDSLIEPLRRLREFDERDLPRRPKDRYDAKEAHQEKQWNKAVELAKHRWPYVSSRDEVAESVQKVLDELRPERDKFDRDLDDVDFKYLNDRNDLARRIRNIQDEIRRCGGDPGGAVPADPLEFQKYAPPPKDG